MLGRIKSTRQVTNRPTFMKLPGSAERARIPSRPMLRPLRSDWFYRAKQVINLSRFAPQTGLRQRLVHIGKVAAQRSKV